MHYREANQNLVLSQILDKTTKQNQETTIQQIGTDPNPKSPK